MNRAKEPRLVRILLSPQGSSHEVMSTRIPLPRAVKEPKIVLPSAHKEEEQKLGSSSGWRRDHLKMLGVKFYAKTKLDLNHLLDVRESDWTPELRARMSRCYLANF